VAADAQTKPTDILLLISKADNRFMFLSRWLLLDHIII